MEQICQPRKYSVGEIGVMRRALLDINTPLGQAFYQTELDAKVEIQLQTHMQNGTEPGDLTSAASEKSRQEFEAFSKAQEFWREASSRKPEPRALRTSSDVIDEWFETSVVRYPGASVEAKELFDGFSGMTLKRFANNHAPDGVHITQKDMECYLDSKGIRSRHAMFAKRYDGIRHVISGNVRNHNYST